MPTLGQTKLTQHVRPKIVGFVRRYEFGEHFVNVIEIVMQVLFVDHFNV
jgi:hypothetical protein